MLWGRVGARVPAVGAELWQSRGGPAPAVHVLGHPRETGCEPVAPRRVPVPIGACRGGRRRAGSGQPPGWGRGRHGGRLAASEAAPPCLCQPRVRRSVSFPTPQGRGDRVRVCTCVCARGVLFNVYISTIYTLKELGSLYILHSTPWRAAGG